MWKHFLTLQADETKIDVLVYRGKYVLMSVDDEEMEVVNNVEELNHVLSEVIDEITGVPFLGDTCYIEKSTMKILSDKF